jgi:glycine/D-amino acid oxidase-like deaminating enzyme
MFSDKSPLSFQDPLPAEVDVVVIGAGVIGIFTAWFLRERGHRVLVCEKGRVAGEQSSRNWGWIRTQGRDVAELPIAIESVASWERISRELDTEIGFERRGVLYAATDQAKLAQLEQWLPIAHDHDLDARMLTSNQVDELVRGRPGQWAGGLYTPSDARAEPFRAVPAVARELCRRGGLVREQCAVRAIDMRAGRVCGVVTEEGVVGAGVVVCAAGAWSRLLLGNLGVLLPQLRVRATVARTARAPDVFGGAAALGEIAIRRREDGGYTVASSSANEHLVGLDSFRFLPRFLPALRASASFLSLRFDGALDRMRPVRRWGADEVTPFERRRVLNPRPSQKALRAVRDGLVRRLPALANLPFEQTWAGFIDVTPDVVPVIDAVPGLPGMWVSTGYSGHGFGIGAGAGRVTADLVTGGDAGHDLTRFRFSRFSDSSRMVPGPGL